MTFEELKDKALQLPTVPGVYIMRDKNDTVIYVGKAKKLKNRVSQYFQDTASHTPKTMLMVSKINDFEVIVANSEFDALVLECNLIKHYLPKYNILLKDDKGYPYIRLKMTDIYPRLSIVNKKADDDADYFGPYGSRGITQGVIEAIQKALRLPDCHKEFPRDIGKARPCLNYHLNLCAGWCQETKTANEYREIMKQARLLLQGNYKSVAKEIRTQMLSAADELNFELAANLRNRLNAVESLGRKQLITAGRSIDTDVIGYAQSETKACFSVLHYNRGNLLDKDYEIISIPDSESEAVSSLVKLYYLNREVLPKTILLPFSIDEIDLISQMLSQKTGRKVFIKAPLRGDSRRLVDLSIKNALEEVMRVTSKEERILAAISRLGKLLSIESPKRIESFDISHIAGTDIVGSMVVFQDGRPKKGDYKRYKIEGFDNQDDYAAIRQVLSRRFSRYIENANGFSVAPDLILVDGGSAHAGIATDVLKEFGLMIPVFGMVKDNRHRTRALVNSDGMEIGIDGNQSVFSLIGNIQEETHRFAISYHKQLRSTRMSQSCLENITGIGPKRRIELLKAFKSVSAIKNATLADLERIVPKAAAAAVYHYFHNQQEG